MHQDRSKFLAQHVNINETLGGGPTVTEEELQKGSQ